MVWQMLVPGAGVEPACLAAAAFKAAVSAFPPPGQAAHEGTRTLVPVTVAGWRPPGAPRRPIGIRVKAVTSPAPAAQDTKLSEDTADTIAGVPRSRWAR